MLAKAGATASAALREPQRLTGALGATANLPLILSFQVVVAGSLLDDLVGMRPHRDDPNRSPEWLLVFVLLSLPVAWFIGRAIGRLHYRSRAATVVIAGASAAVVGAVTVSVLSATDSFSLSRPANRGGHGVYGVLMWSSSRSPLDRQA